MRTIDVVRRISCALLAGFTASANAWDGTVAGKVDEIHITGGNNFGFRVAFTPTAAMCSGGPGWAFLNETDSNYKVYVSSILAAKAMGSTVTIWTTAEIQGGATYCRIGYVLVK